MHIDRTGPLAFGTLALVNLVDVLFNNFGWNLLRSAQKITILMAFVIAEGLIALFQSAEQDGGIAIRAFCHNGSLSWDSMVSSLINAASRIGKSHQPLSFAELM